MTQIGRMRFLEDLTFFGADLCDENIAQLRSLTSLTTLSLSALSKTTNQAMLHIACLTSLTSLDCSSWYGDDFTRTGFDDAAVADVASSCKKLTHLYCNYCSAITDAALPHLLSLENLKHCGLCETQMTDQAKEKLRQLSVI